MMFTIDLEQPDMRLVKGDDSIELFVNDDDDDNGLVVKWGVVNGQFRKQLTLAPMGELFVEALTELSRGFVVSSI
jgi:hypothetical protein